MRYKLESAQGQCKSRSAPAAMLHQLHSQVAVTGRSLHKRTHSLCSSGDDSPPEG